MSNGSKTDIAANNGLDPQRPNLTAIKRFAYASGDLGCCLAYSMINNFLNYFMTDVAMILPTIVGNVMLVSKIWDAVIDPFIGSMADHTNTKYGRYRPWVIGAAVPMLVLNVFAFTTSPDWTQNTRTIFAFGAYFASVTAYSCLNIPYSAMLSVVTLDGDMRAKMASARETGAMVGSLLLAIFAQRIVKWIQESMGSEALGFQISTIIFGCIALPFFIFCFAGTKEVVKTEPTKEKYWSMYRTLKNNKPFLCITLFFVVWGFNSLGGGMKIYFFKYVGGKDIMFSNNLVVNTAAMIVGTSSLTFLIGKVKSKGHIMVVAALASAVFQSCNAFVDITTTSGEILYYCITACAGICNGLNLASMFAIQPDVTEYTRYNHGIYAAGFLSSFTNFCFQFGGALATASCNWILGGIGYVANVEQTPTVLTVLRYMPHLWPAFMMVLGAIVMSRYPLTKEVFAQITAKLDKGEYAPGVKPMGAAE